MPRPCRRRKRAARRLPAIGQQRIVLRKIVPPRIGPRLPGTIDLRAPTVRPAVSERTPLVPLRRVRASLVRRKAMRPSLPRSELRDRRRPARRREKVRQKKRRRAPSRVRQASLGARARRSLRRNKALRVQLRSRLLLQGQPRNRKARPAKALPNRAHRVPARNPRQRPSRLPRRGKALLRRKSIRGNKTDWTGTNGQRPRMRWPFFMS